MTAAFFASLVSEFMNISRSVSGESIKSAGVGTSDRGSMSIACALSLAGADTSRTLSSSSDSWSSLSLAPFGIEFPPLSAAVMPARGLSRPPIAPLQRLVIGGSVCEGVSANTSLSLPEFGIARSAGCTTDGNSVVDPKISSKSLGGWSAVEDAMTRRLFAVCLSPDRSNGTSGPARYSSPCSERAAKALVAWEVARYEASSPTEKGRLWRDRVCCTMST